MRYHVTHTTRYTYSESVSLCYNEARMTPRDDSSQSCIGTSLTIEPKPTNLRTRVDYFGNQTTYFDVEAPHDALSVFMASEVETSDLRAQLELLGWVSWEDVGVELRNDGELPGGEHHQYLFESPMVPRGLPLDDLTGTVFTPGRPFVEAILALTEHIHREVAYDPVATTVATPIAEVIAQRRGVCQDLAHLMIACLRSVGLAAGYVSGYLETEPPPGRPKLLGVDASHAWVAVYAPGHGWLELDPTNAKMPDERYIVLARGRDYGDVAPLKGVVFGGGTTTLEVSVDVIPQYDVET